MEESPRHLIRDRDQIYGERFSRQARTLGIREAVIGPRSLWQNAYAERVIGSIRRECLDHLVVIGERYLMGILAEYVDYTTLMVEILKDNARPEAGEVYGAMDMAWAKLVGQIAHAYGK